jgi:hypothetical protein
MIDYSLILITKYAGQEWTLNGEDYEGLTWLSNTSKPSKAELDAQWEDVKAEVDAAIETKAQAKVALLERLGITADEAALLLG